MKQIQRVVFLMNQQFLEWQCDGPVNVNVRPQVIINVYYKVEPKLAHIIEHLDRRLGLI